MIGARGLGSAVLKRVSIRCASASTAAGDAASATSSSSSAPPAPPRPAKLYELRTYAVAPYCLGEFLKLTEKHLHLRTAHSKLLGYWMSQLGGINEVVHVWEYDSYAHRSAVRKALAEDKKWVETYFTKILSMFVSQDNVIMHPVDWYRPKVEVGKSYGAYELVCHTMEHAHWSQYKSGKLKDLVLPTQDHVPRPLGIWYSVFGPLNTVYELWPHNSLDEAMKDGGTAESRIMSYVKSSKNKALTALPFSPAK